MKRLLMVVAMVALTAGIAQAGPRVVQSPPVPEPMSMMLGALGLSSIVGIRRLLKK